METNMEFPQNGKNRNPSHDPAIALLGVHPKKWNAGSQRDAFTPLFLTPLFTATKR